jgi:cellulose synthase (UDP-forming)
MALIYSSIIIFWLTYNVINLVYAVFFMWGRKIYRKSERFEAVMPMQVFYDNRTLDAHTVNVSEGGLAFSLDKPEYIPTDKPVSFLLYNDRYRTVFEGFIVYVKQAGSQWYYGVTIHCLDDENRRQYMQIIYDRMHSLPTKLNVWVTAFDDLTNNMIVRVEKQRTDMRALPRIELNRSIVFDDGSCGLLADFNYRYALVKHLSAQGAQSSGEKRFTCTLEVGLVLILEPVKDWREREGMLMHVVNWEDLIYHAGFKQILYAWSEQHREEVRTKATAEADASQSS